jgi:hypothetical protein
MCHIPEVSNIHVLVYLWLDMNHCQIFFQIILPFVTYFENKITRHTYEDVLHSMYYTVFSLTQLNFLLTSIREATCFGVFKPPSSGLLLDEYSTRMLR